MFDQGNRITQPISCADVADVCVKALHNTEARNRRGYIILSIILSIMLSIFLSIILSIILSVCQFSLNDSTG